jgi:hypothetical protein
MAYVPTVPGVPAPMSYGQGYGNWQQYAGFDKTTNPYGGGEGLGVQPSDVLKNKLAGIQPPEYDTNFPTQDYSMPAPTGGMGNNPQNSLGLKPTTQLGVVQNNTEQAIKSHYGVQ